MGRGLPRPVFFPLKKIFLDFGISSAYIVKSNHPPEEI
jgi:hypothetical protein